MGKMRALVRNRSVYLGLTSERLILFPVDLGRPANEAISLWLTDEVFLKWSRFWDRLQVQLPNDRLNIRPVKGLWAVKLRQFVDAYDEIQKVARAITPEKYRELAVSLRALGLVGSAHSFVRQAYAAPQNEASGPTVSLDEIPEKLLALRVGAGFLFVNIAILLLSGIISVISENSINYVTVVITTLIDTAIGINLWRGDARQWAPWAVLRAVLGLVFTGFSNLVQGRVLGFVLIASLCVPLIMVLTGRGNRTKTWIAIGIFLMGYLGPLVVSLLLRGV
jgi:hypothetical protein